MSNASEPDVDPIRDHKRMRMLMFIGAAAYLFVGTVTLFVIPSLVAFPGTIGLIVYVMGFIGVLTFVLAVKWALEARREYHEHE